VRGLKVKDPNILTLADKYERTTAQILIRYSLQKGWVPLPKSDNPGRIWENVEVFEFEIEEEDMEMLDGLDEGGRGAVGESNSDPLLEVTDCELRLFFCYSHGGHQPITLSNAPSPMSEFATTYKGTVAPDKYRHSREKKEGGKSKWQQNKLLVHIPWPAVSFVWNCFLSMTCELRCLSHVDPNHSERQRASLM
jgi:hypothetical protein